MKPADPTKLNQLLQRKSILMLDAIGLTVNFIDTIVRQSPGLITTKKGKKTLPLELWLEILEWTREWSWHLLVQPQGLEDGSTNTLICAKIPEWNPCGRLQDNSDLEVYEYYLNQPGDGPNDDRPFTLPQTLDKDSTWKIPVTALGQEDMILCGDLRVPDVIARVENGECGICLGYARKDLWLTDDRNEGKEGYLTDEEYDAWVQNRFRELEY
ncbi:hypothetical protein MRS44_011583 [Fusarium solani]|uniref:uncharacterized protein n=1 Tax=Fusarium solani TaxID=169388 RepID=UPI0032C45D3B|nr:hypothetical protein MRS44_011583 [Fusarium solani]